MLWEFKYLYYKEKTSEKLLQQVAIKKLNWNHNYGTILTNIIIIIIMSWHIYLFWGFSTTTKPVFNSL